MPELQATRSCPGKNRAESPIWKGKNPTRVTHPRCDSLMAAWSAAPPRVPTNHSPSPQRLTRRRALTGSRLTTRTAPAVATTSAEDELSPAPIGMSPLTRSEEHTSELQSLRHLVC